MLPLGRASLFSRCGPVLTPSCAQSGEEEWVQFALAFWPSQQSNQTNHLEYWSGLTSGMHFFNKSIVNCIFVLHKDITMIWNIRGMNEVCLQIGAAVESIFTLCRQYFLSEEFRARMTTVVEDLNNNADGQPVCVITCVLFP